MIKCLLLTCCVLRGRLSVILLLIIDFLRIAGKKTDCKSCLNSCVSLSFWVWTSMLGLCWSLRLFCLLSSTFPPSTTLQQKTITCLSLQRKAKETKKLCAQVLQIVLKAFCGILPGLQSVSWQLLDRYASRQENVAGRPKLSGNENVIETSLIISETECDNTTSSKLLGC